LDLQSEQLERARLLVAERSRPADVSTESSHVAHSPTGLGASYRTGSQTDSCFIGSLVVGARRTSSSVPGGTV
jgi:hypothetical protein